MQLVKFWADWCMPCMKSEPIFQSLKLEFQGRIDFQKIDVDANPQAAMNFGVQSVPKLLVLDDQGRPVADLTNLAFSATGLRNALENLLTAA